MGGKYYASKIVVSKLDPTIESFSVTLICVCLPNFPLHYWFQACFVAIDNSLGNFICANENSKKIIHTTFSKILVELDTSKALSTEIN